METNLVKSSYASITQLPIALVKNSSGSEQNLSLEKLASLLIQFITQLKKTEPSLNMMNAYRNDLNLFCEFLTEKQITLNNYTLRAQDYWFNFLKENGRQSKASIRRAQMSVHSFLHFIASGEIMSQSDFSELKSTKQPAHVMVTVPHDKFLTLSHAVKTKAMTGDSKSIRDWALILILGECGLKATEIANLTWGDIQEESEDFKVENFSNTAGFLHVKSGNKERLVPYSREVAEALNLLKEVRTNLNLSTTLTSKLFFGYLNISRRTRSNFLHRHGIKFVVYEVCSDILGVPYNSESLRNHAILRWIGKGLDNKKVATLAGYTTMNSMLKFFNAPKFKTNSKRKMKS